jgi:hypothetical protein
MANREPAFTQQLDAWERATAMRYRGTEPASRGTDSTQLDSRGIAGHKRETPAQHRARQHQFEAKLKAAAKASGEDKEKKDFDFLEERLRRIEQQPAGAIAGTAAGAIVKSHKDKLKNGNLGVGYGGTWADDEASKKALKALGLKKVPKKGDRKHADYVKQFWAEREKITEPLSKLEEMSCVTMLQKPLEAYAKMSGRLNKDEGAREKKLEELIKKAHDARPHAANEHDARGTVVLEELRDKFGFETVHVDALKGDPKKYWNNQDINPKTKRPIINYSSDAAARQHKRLPVDKDHRNVEGKDSGDQIDVSVGIDHFVKLKGKPTPETTKWWKELKETEFAVGVADQGFHTFAISEGYVYEVHWDRGPDDPTLTGRRSLEDFFRPDNRKKGEFGWGSGVIAIPPEALPKKAQDKGP